MYKLVDKYILQHFIGKVFITLLAFIVIFLLVDIVDHLDHIMDSEMSSREIIRYYYHTVPWYFSLGLPMSLLLATVFTFGILQKNNEKIWLFLGRISKIPWFRATTSLITESS